MLAFFLVNMQLIRDTSHVVHAVQLAADESETETLFRVDYNVWTVLHSFMPSLTADFPTDLCSGTRVGKYHDIFENIKISKILKISWYIYMPSSSKWEITVFAFLLLKNLFRWASIACPFPAVIRLCLLLVAVWSVPEPDEEVMHGSHIDL